MCTSSQSFSNYFPVVCFVQTDDYSEARRKMKEYLDSDTAGLQSEEEGQQKKRNIKKKFDWRLGCIRRKYFAVVDNVLLLL